MSNLAREAEAFSRQVIHTLRRAGHVAYWAGGCVRDRLLGRTTIEFDVATSARPEEVQRLFRRTVAVGASFGVINVLGPPGIQVEVATFRTDDSYTDGRRPDAITYSTPEEDARRRDFTINGMFLDPDGDRILDYVGGQEDIKRRIIRAIGSPRDRFQEDKLRMLRGARFAANLGFAIDEPTLEAIVAMASSLTVISAERILAEVKKMLEPPTRAAALEWLSVTGLFPVVFPELTGVDRSAVDWRTTTGILEHWRGAVSVSLALAGLLATQPDELAAKNAEEILRRLKASNDERETCAWLVRHRHALDAAANLPMSRTKRILAHPKRDELLDLIEASEWVATGDAPNARHLRGRLRAWEEEGSLDPPPLVTGDDLVALGYKPGIQFKEMLEAARDRQLQGELEDKEAALDWIFRKWPRATD